MKSKLFAFVLACSSLIVAMHQVAAQTTAFTYQGRLNETGNPASGLYDLRFTIYDTVSAGNAVAGPLTNAAVAVSNGLFTVLLDFGAGVFDGNAYWLEISVRTNGGGAFVPLNPRQPLTPTPYAITASNLSGTLPASQLSGALPSANLGGTYSGAITLNNAANSFSGNGAGLTGLDASALANGTVSDARLPANVARLNAHQTFTGTNVFLANVGIGTAASTNRLEVADLQARARLSSSGLFGSVLELGDVNEDPSSLGSIDFTHTTGLQGRIGYSWNGMDFLTANRLRMRIDPAGNIQVQNSIRLDAADAPMIVRQWDTFTSGSKAGFGRWGMFMEPAILYLGMPGTDYPLDSSIQLGGWLADGTRQSRLTVMEGGNVGIGTTSPAEALHVERSQASVRITSTGSTDVGSLLQLMNTTSNATTIANIVMLGQRSGDSATLKLLISGGGPQLQIYLGAVKAASFHDNLVEINPLLWVNDGIIARRENAEPLLIFRLLSDGKLVDFRTDTGPKGSISVAGETVSYNAFTGSHFAWTEQALHRGQLVRMTGVNRRLDDRPAGEVIYGVLPTLRANDPACLGAYLALQEPAQPASTTNPHLVMAVGNGELWVVESNSDIEPGDCLVSSEVEGCAMKDDPARFAVGHVVARAAERVAWSQVPPDADGSKRRLLSVLFGPFIRGALDKHIATVDADGVALAAIQGLNQKLEETRAENAELKARLFAFEKLVANLSSKGN